MPSFSPRRSVPFFAAASALVLAACASLPPAQPARVAKAPQAYETAQTLAAPTADWPADAWWTAYGDAQLNALEDEALKGSPTLAAAEAICLSLKHKDDQRVRRLQDLHGSIVQ